MKYNLRATNWEGVGLDRPITLKYPIISDIIPQLLAWLISPHLLKAKLVVIIVAFFPALSDK